MRQLKRRSLLSHFLPQELDGKYDQAQNKDQQADTIDAMHITDPFAFRTVRILLLNIEIFGDLCPDSHDDNVKRQN